jgi:hypothetical protein
MNNIKQESKLISALESTFLEFANLSKSFQEVTASLSNLITRCSLFANSIRSTTVSQRRRNIGPLSLFGGAPDRVLLLRHCREAQKQQRNLQLIFDALSRSRSTTISLADDLRDLQKVIEFESKKRINEDSDVSDNAKIDACLVQRRIDRILEGLSRMKLVLTQESVSAVEVLFASSALAVCLDVDISDERSINNRGEGGDEGENVDSLGDVSVSWIKQISISGGNNHIQKSSIKEKELSQENKSSNKIFASRSSSAEQLLDEEFALCEKINRSQYINVDSNEILFLSFALT